MGGYARGRVAHSPAFANGDLVVVNETGHITSFDGVTGLVRWEHEMERDVITEPVAAGNSDFDSDQRPPVVRLQFGHRRRGLGV